MLKSINLKKTRTTKLTHLIVPLPPPPPTITTTPCSPPNRAPSSVLPRRHQCRHIRLHRRQRLSRVRVPPMIRPATMVSRPLPIIWTLIFQQAGPCKWHRTAVYFSSITTNEKRHGWIRERVAPALCPIRRVSSKTIWAHCRRAGRNVFTLTVASSLSITVSSERKYILNSFIIHIIWLHRHPNHTVGRSTIVQSQHCRSSSTLF